MRVIELKVEVDTVVALTLHPRLTVVDAGSPNDTMINAIRSLADGDQVKVHAVVAEGDRHHLRDADELRALGWTGDAVMLDVESMPPLAEVTGKAKTNAEEGDEGPIADLAAKVAAAGRAVETTEHALARATDALAGADTHNENAVADLRAHEEAIEELKSQRAEVETRHSDLAKRQSVITAHLDKLAELRTDPPRTPEAIVATIEGFDALPAESIDEIRAALREWNRPVLSTYDLLMGSHQAPSSLEEQFGLTRSEPAEGQVAVAKADTRAEVPALPASVLDHLDKARLTLAAQAERIKDISGTIQESVAEGTKAVTDRQRQLSVARAAMLARTGERETLRHQYERTLEAATAARDQLADLETAGRLVQHIAGMPVHPAAGRPPLVIEHRSNDQTRRDQLLRALPVISGETQVVVVTSDPEVLNWARRLSGIDGVLRSASAL